MSEEKRFTLEELARCDGKEGRPAYFAVDGIVFDASGTRLWRDGVHVRLHKAGQDLTESLKAAPHPADRLDRVPRVGVLIAKTTPPPAPPADETPGFAKLAYAMHAHPASVHFPVALCVVAALMEAVGLVTGWMPPCGTFSTCAMVIGVALSPPAILSGFIDWKYQFDARATRIFKAKIAMSFVFLAVGICAIVLRLGCSQPCLLTQALFIAMAPIALLLGFLGGRITFPKA
jgi:predicted heme/steroid binding protein/uncharacterized membrane protein